ncbi:MAG TPA: SMI1/KNR4 family protein [Phycisphaerales bacterium]|nr:SMI1/KNR4 family protein [Phycisphaerales bacterium]
MNWARKGKPTSEAEVIAFEQRIGATLPADYRAFLVTHNGGKPTTPYFSYPGADGKPDPTWVTRFGELGLSASDLNSIEYRPDYYDDDLPKDTVVIAHAASNDVVLLYVRGERAGQVWYKCFGMCAEEGVPEEQLYFVANSFDAFISMLRKDM